MFSRTKIRELEYLAFHDDLTKLKNRTFLYRRANIFMFNFLYFIDINGLKIANLSGHSYGDKLILTVVDEIKTHLKDDDLFIRYAGDEFIVLSTVENLLISNELYCTGCSKVLQDLVLTINAADTELIKEKLSWKRKKEKLEK